MRFILTTVGLLVVAIGSLVGFNAYVEDANRLLMASAGIVLAGVVVASIGAATIDIVSAIDRCNGRDAGQASKSLRHPD